MRNWDVCGEMKKVGGEHELAIDSSICRFRLTQGPRCHFSMFEDFGMGQPDCVARSTLRTYANPSHEVLAKIKDPLLAGASPGFDAFDLLNTAYGRPIGRSENLCVEQGSYDRMPGVIIEACRRPARRISAIVVGFAIVDFRPDHSTDAALSLVISCDRLGRSVFVGDDELSDDAERVAPDIASPPEEAEPTREPSLAYVRAEHVYADFEVFRNIEGLIWQFVMVARPTRRKHMVTDALAINLSLVNAVGGNVEPCSVNRRWHMELPAKKERLMRQVRFLPTRTLNQRTGPILRVQKACLDSGTLRPGCRGTLLCVGSNANGSRLSRDKWTAGPRDEHALIRVYAV
ncbi:hypothetical protein NKR23_g4684 [Pleurostoma richardsiae]|uniref:Uncharacterized protein n=1 Tax=Pleurostoma richardsiae TaxID=41990 RepID=A0AA38S1P0_9PEZI|nr:hypothetical protein NKR23_g4684 [Pleurostoma richardsiae]